MATEAQIVAFSNALVEKYLDTYFASTAVVERVDGGKEMLFLTKAPIISVTTIEDTFNSDEVVTASAYDFYSDRGMIYIKNNNVFTVNLISPNLWAKGRQRFRVTYQAGYASAPEDIKLATTMLATELQNRLDPSISEIELGDYTKKHIMEVFGWNPKIKMILDMYKIRNV